MNFCQGKLPATFPHTSNHPQLLGVFTYLFFIILLYLLKNLGRALLGAAATLQLQGGFLIAVASPVVEHRL